MLKLPKAHNCLFGCILFIGSAIFFLLNRHVNNANYATKGHPHKPIENKSRSNVTIISYSRSSLFGRNTSELENVTAPVKSMYLCVLFTTLIHSKKSDGVKMLVQENVLHAFRQLLQHGFQIIVFTSDPYWNRRAKLILPSAHVTDRFHRNEYGTPLLRSMYLKSFSMVKNSYFYAYTNADLLFDHNFAITLKALRLAIESNKLVSNRIFLTGRRRNVDAVRRDKEPVMVDGDLSYYNNIFKQLYLNSTLFVQSAQDYFVVTRNTFDWQYVVRRISNIFSLITDKASFSLSLASCPHF